MERINEINKRIEEIHPKTVLWKHVLGCVFGVIAVFLCLFVSIYLFPVNQIVSIVLIVVCVLSAFLLVVELINLTSTLKYREEYASLISEKAELEKEKGDDKKEDFMDTILKMAGFEETAKPKETTNSKERTDPKEEKLKLLLKLFEEGKITKEEFIELSK